MTRQSVSSTGSSASKSLHWEQNYGEHIVVCPPKDRSWSKLNLSVLSSLFSLALHLERHGKEQTLRPFYNSPIKVGPIWGMLEEPILAAAVKFSTILLEDKAASEDWLLYDRLVWNSEKFIELFATTTRAGSVGHQFTTHKKFFVDKDLLS
jgi:hypothetical protein